MRRIWLKALTSFLIFQNFHLVSSEYDEETPQYCQPYCEEEQIAALPWEKNALTIGPEIYYLKRNRAGGTTQDGTIWGGRATFDHIKRYNIYVGAQALYATGILNGKSGNDSKLKSRWTDREIEGYLGYTFQMKCFPYFAFTPFLGYGYMWECNKFLSPSPLRVKFDTNFAYLPYGFLSSIAVSSNFTVGINARFRYIWDVKSKVSNDPEFGSFTLLAENHQHYRIELPLLYHRKFCRNMLEVGLVPFYEQRLYGGRENFPFDFFKTTIRAYGANLQLMYRF